ncbi:MAG: hypothetical protein Kow006_13240 [Gammaproteobacteria bacterium]
MRIRRRLQRLLLIFSALPVMALSVVSVWLLESYFTATRQATLIRQAANTSGLIKATLDAKRARAEDFASDGYIRERLVRLQGPTLPAHDEESALLSNHLLRNKLGLDPDLVDIHVINRAGLVVGDSDRDLIGLSQEGDELSLGDLSASRIINTTSSELEGARFRRLAVATPIRSLTGDELLGKLVNLYDYGAIEAALQNAIGALEKAAGWILDAQGQSIASINADHLPLPAGAADSCLTPDEERAAGAGSGSLIWAADCVTPPGGTGRWAVIVAGTPHTGLPLRPLQGTLLLFAALLLAGGWLAARRMAGALARPLERLRLAAARIGAGDLEHRTGVTGNDELAELGRAIDAMCDNLRRITASRAELENEITARREAEASLKHAANLLADSNRELAQFAYIASHDLQEPLRMISSYLQLLERRYRERLDDDAREFIDFAVDGAKRLQAMIQSLLEYSRIETRGEAFAPVALDDCAAEARADLAQLIEERGAEIECGALPNVRGDRQQLTRLLRNLIGNGLKYNRGRPRIEVRAFPLAEAPEALRPADHPAGGGWLVSVTDNGIGIAPEHQTRIFDMFRRLHSRAEFPGTGIGLSICRRIVERHGGRIWVVSRAGAGATFCFTLPEAGYDEGSGPADAEASKERP